MYVLVTYDIATDTKEGRTRVRRAAKGRARVAQPDRCRQEGRTRLRRAAKACLDYGQRVQNSVFEMKVDPAQWTACRDRLLQTIYPDQDSLRFYFLGKSWRRKVEHHGAKPSFDIDGPLIV